MFYQLAMINVPASIKVVASIQKLFLHPTYALWCVLPKIIQSSIVKLDEIWENTPISDHFDIFGYYSRASFIGAITVIQ